MASFLLHRPSFYPPGCIPEHPLVAASGDKGGPDADLLRRVEIIADSVGEVEDGLDEGAEVLAAVGVYPLLVHAVWRAMFEEGFAYLPVDPVTWQHCAQHLRVVTEEGSLQQVTS